MDKDKDEERMDTIKNMAELAADFFKCPNRNRKKQCRWYGSREELLSLSVIRFGRNGINFICPICGDSFGCPAYNIRLTSSELDRDFEELEKSPSIDKVEAKTNSLYRDEALEAKLEKLRDEWADIANAIDKIYGVDSPTANVYRLCIGAIHRVVKGDQF